MTQLNGAREIPWAPTVPPNSPPVPPKEDEPETGNYNSGFFADLFCWWRTRRERRLIERIRQLESQNSLLTEENLSLGLMVERINRHVQAQTVLSVRMADGLASEALPRRRGP